MSVQKGNLESQSCVDLKHQTCQSRSGTPIPQQQGKNDRSRLVRCAGGITAVSECCACLSPAATCTLPGHIAHAGARDVNLGFQVASLDPPGGHNKSSRDDSAPGNASVSPSSQPKKPSPAQCGTPYPPPPPPSVVPQRGPTMIGAHSPAEFGTRCKARPSSSCQG